MYISHHKSKYGRFKPTQFRWMCLNDARASAPWSYSHANDRRRCNDGSSATARDRDQHSSYLLRAEGKPSPGLRRCRSIGCSSRRWNAARLVSVTCAIRTVTVVESLSRRTCNDIVHTNGQTSIPAYCCVPRGTQSHNRACLQKQHVIVIARFSSRRYLPPWRIFGLLSRILRDAITATAVANSVGWIRVTWTSDVRLVRSRSTIIPFRLPLSRYHEFPIGVGQGIKIVSLRAFPGHSNRRGRSRIMSGLCTGLCL